MPAKIWIRRALCHYVKSYAYLNSLVAGQVRLDLQGIPNGQVSEQEAIQARNELNQQKKKDTRPVKQPKVSEVKNNVCNDSQNTAKIQECIPKNLVARKVLTLKKKSNQ